MPLGGSRLPQLGRSCRDEQSNEWTEKESERDMTPWWTANLLGAQRDSADWLNANSPPARGEQWQWCMRMRVSWCPSECIPVCLLEPTWALGEFLVVVHHTNMPGPKQSQSPPHPTFINLSMVPAYSYWFSTEIKLRLFKPPLLPNYFSKQSVELFSGCLFCFVLFTFFFWTPSLFSHLAITFLHLFILHS